MVKVNIKVSGCFRTQRYARVRCRHSSYLSTMAALGYSPLAAVEIALKGEAVNVFKLHHAQHAPKMG